MLRSLCWHTHTHSPTVWWWHYSYICTWKVFSRSFSASLWIPTDPAASVCPSLTVSHRGMNVFFVPTLSRPGIKARLPRILRTKINNSTIISPSLGADSFSAGHILELSPTQTYSAAQIQSSATPSAVFYAFCFRYKIQINQASKVIKLHLLRIYCCSL